MSIKLFIAIGLAIFMVVYHLEAGERSDEKPKQDFTQKEEVNYVEILFGAAKRNEDEGRYKRALKYYKKIEKYADKLIDKANAVIAQGKCLEKMSRPWKAFSHYRRAVDEYSNFIPFMDILKLEYEIANNFFSGQKEKVLFFSVSTYPKAVEIYNHIAQIAPYSPSTVNAIYRSGLLSKKMKNYEDAAERFRLIITRYSSSDKIEEAKIELADVLLQLASQADSDGTLVEQTYRVLSTINNFKLSASRSDDAKALLQTTQSLQAKRLLYLAEFYQRPSHNSNKTASKRYLNQILSKYPSSESRGRAEELLSIIENQNSQPIQTPN